MPKSLINSPAFPDISQQIREAIDCGATSRAKIAVLLDTSLVTLKNRLADHHWPYTWRLALRKANIISDTHGL
jgi:hypothetical protein